MRIRNTGTTNENKKVIILKLKIIMGIKIRMNVLMRIK